MKEALYLEPRLSLPLKSQASSEVVLDLASEILTIMPPLFDLAEVDQRHPLSYDQSLNTVLRQVIKFSFTFDEIACIFICTFSGDSSL